MLSMEKDTKKHLEKAELSNISVENFSMPSTMISCDNKACGREENAGNSGPLATYRALPKERKSIKKSRAKFSIIGEALIKRACRLDIQGIKANGFRISRNVTKSTNDSPVL